MQKAQDDAKLDVEVADKVKSDADLIARLMENNPVEEAKAARKQGRGIGRLRKLFEHGPREVTIARGLHTDPVTGKTTAHEIKVTVPAEKPFSTPKVTYHTKKYNVLAHNMPVEIEKTFGPTFTNRRQKRAMNRLMVQAMKGKGKKNALAAVGLDV